MNKLTVALILFILHFSFFTLFAQQGKSGALTVSTTVEVNEYTYLTANAPAGSTTITVASSTLNAHSRFPVNLAAGDLLMIIQMQGATLNGHIDVTYGNVGLPNDSSWGSILNYNNCGNYEFAEVSAVPSGTTITLDCPLQYSYIDTGKVQIVRMPRYTTLTINNGGTITCDQWDSAIGGIVAIEVEGNTVINTGGSINADSAGFRGGRYNGQDSIGWGVVWASSTFQSLGKEKGEGIGGYEWSYKKYGGKESYGAPGNGGGGGACQNAGGGGGANGGVVANYINGYGNPNISTNNYRTAWALEYSWMPTFTSSGGGRGGYTFSDANISPLTYGPGNTTWNGDHRDNTGGRGGRPLNYSTGKIFMAGGGGAGDQNDDNGGTGAKGGGIVYLMSYGTVSGAGQIVSNGENGFNAHGTASFSHAAGIDGAGGGGGGGTVIVNSTGAISGITLTANGGAGGNQVITWNVSTDPEAEGPGGGGGGGYIATSNTGLTETATGGANGTTNAIPMGNFPPNGATIGGAGTTGATITNFYIVAKNDTICSGNSATLTASLMGTVPSGTTIEWYTTQTGGSAIATGTTYVTPTLTTNTTYYVGTCPGTYRIAVTVVISGSASVTISPNKSICKGTTDSLKATGGTAYSWLPTTNLSCTACANPIASPTTTTTYTVTITTSCGPIKDSVKITVLPLPTATITATSNPICAGKSTTITASGGTSYSWSTGATTSAITVTPASTTTYTVGVSNGTCAKDTSIKITVNPLPTPTIAASVNPLCSGNPTTITASGGTSYTWSNSATTSSITVSPTTTTNYSVIVSNGVCTKDTNITITVNTTPTVTISPPSATLCTGGNVLLTASGATTYTWTPSTNLTCTNCANPTASPTTTTTYTVTGTSTGCTGTATITVSVTNTLTAVINPQNDSVCKGSPTTLTASGGATYKWNTGATTAVITVSPLVNTNYSVVVSSGGCKDSTNETVKVLAVPVIGSSGNVTICSGSSTTLTATGGTTYLWNTGATASSLTVNPTLTTNYTVVGTNNSGCSDSAMLTVTVNPTPVVSVTPSHKICSGTSDTLVATGGGTYLWSPGGQTSDSIIVNPTSQTIYSVVVTVGGCSKDTLVKIGINPLPTVTLQGTTLICAGDSTNLIATGGGTYLWSTGQTTQSIIVDPSGTFTYSLAVTKGGCTKDTTLKVNVAPKPVQTVNGPFTICLGESVNLIASGGTDYTWSPSGSLNSSTTSDPDATPASTTLYTVIVSNAAGCVAKDSILVMVTAGASGDACCDATIQPGTSQQLSVSGASSASSYAWTPESGLSCNTCPDPVASPTITTVYYVTITDSNGCKRTDSLRIVVGETCGNVFLPDAFSPNGDGVNDKLYVRGGCISTMDLEIFDRWGNKVFTSNKTSDFWDGTFKGQPMPTGTYVYFLKVTLDDGTNTNTKGNITLVR